MRPIVAVFSAVSLLLAACGPSASEKGQAATLISELLCTTDVLDTLNPLNPAASMNQLIPTFSEYLRQKGASKRQVAVMRKLASAGDREVEVFAESVRQKMSGTCPGRKNMDLAKFATGMLIGMIDQVPSLRNAGI